jgi:very-short-patch-repair endonuclease
MVSVPVDGRSTGLPRSATVGRMTRFDDVFRGSDAIAAGALTPGRLRGPEFQRLFRDVYVRAPTRVTHELRCRAASLALPAGAVITGRSAATVRGVRVAWPDDPVQILAPAEMRLGRRRGCDVRRTAIEPSDSVPWAFGRLATPMRLALDLLLDRPVWDAVAGLDAVLRAGLVDRDHVASMVARRSDNGIVEARRAVDLADARAESLPESIMRVHLVLAGLAPVPQHVLEIGRDRFVRFDLAFREKKVAVEYDGDWRDGELWALNRDRDRLNAVHELGWDVVFVTAPLLRDPRRLVRTVCRALDA